METEKNTEKLAGLTIKVIAVTVAAAACWYFRSTLVYIAMAAVVSFICRPLAKLLGKIEVRGKKMPSWLVAIVSIFIVLFVLTTIVTQIFPVVTGIIASVSSNLDTVSIDGSIFAKWLEKTNLWLIDRIPKLGRDFKIQDAFINWISDTFDVSSVTSVVGSVASAIGNVGIALFSIIFIGFFFVKDESLFRKIIGALVPDKIENDAIKAVGEIEHLLTRYFVGLVCEVLGVALLNFLGLWTIARTGFYPAVGIAFIAGMLNIIPYVGPWIGCAIGTTLGAVIKFSNAAVTGVYPSIWTVVITLLAIFVFTQIIDNFLFQPMIYSKSIKSSPLEIFIVLLMAGHIGGIAGMLAAIPAYTVIRVIASRFLRDIKPVRRLMEATED